MAGKYNPEFETFDGAIRKILLVSHKELQRREAEWKGNRAKKKRAKTSPASRASSDKD